MADLWLGTWARFLLGRRLGPYVPTPPHVGARMLELAEVTSSDVVYDLGCGDGRLLIHAARQHGASGVGFELNAELVGMANDAVAAAGVSGLVSVRREDARKADFSPASVVCLYLSERGNRELLPRLQTLLLPSARVVSFSFGIAGITPSATALVDGIGLHLFRGVGQRARSSEEPNYSP